MSERRGDSEGVRLDSMFKFSLANMAMAYSKESRIASGAGEMGRTGDTYGLRNKSSESPSSLEIGTSYCMVVRIVTAPGHRTPSRRLQMPSSSSVCRHLPPSYQDPGLQRTFLTYKGRITSSIKEIISCVISCPHAGAMTSVLRALHATRLPASLRVVTPLTECWEGMSVKHSWNVVPQFAHQLRD